MSSNVILLRPQAERDLENYAAFLAGQSAGLDERFLDAARQTFQEIAQMPGLGSPYESQQPELSGLRFRSIIGFERHLIFYRTADTRIEIVRVLHSARNLDRALGRGV
jgi:toxin ParE1/3/4